MSTQDVLKTTSDNKGTTAVDDMSLLSITDGENDRGIPLVKFIEDVDAFANSFTPPSSAELLMDILQMDIPSVINYSTWKS